MPRIITDVGTISVLASPKLPDNSDNPFYDMVNFLDRTRGRWIEEGDLGKNKKDLAGTGYKVGMGGRSFLEGLVGSQFGTIDTQEQLYISQTFSQQFFPIMSVVGGFQLTAALGRSMEIIDYPAYAIISDSNYGDLVPLVLPNRQYPDPNDESGETIIDHTWETWKDQNHTHMEGLNNTKIVPLNSNTGSGRHIAGSRIVALVLAGINLIPKYELANYVETPEE